MDPATSRLDPYHRWLGIPPEEQPPNHYRLLAIPLYENNRRVIEAAADRQMGFLRTLQAGPHGDVSQTLLNQVAAAKVCLLNPQRKADYDEWLKQQLRSTPGGEALRIEGVPVVRVDARPRASGNRTVVGWRNRATAIVILVTVVAAIGVGLLVHSTVNFPPVRRHVMVVEGIAPDSGTSEGSAAVTPADLGASSAEELRDSEVSAVGTDTLPAVEAPSAVGPPAISPHLPLRGDSFDLTASDGSEDPTAGADPPNAASSEVPQDDSEDNAAGDNSQKVAPGTPRQPHSDSGAPKSSASSPAQEPGHAANTLEREAAVLEAMLDGQRLPPWEPVRIVEQAYDLLDQAVSQDSYELAERLSNLALKAARTRRKEHPQVLDRLRRYEDALRTLQTTHLRIRPVLEASSGVLTDPKSNDAIGQYYCLMKDEWEKGLPYLAAGGDQNLSSLAREERTRQSRAAEDTLYLARAWWALAEQRRGLEQQALRLHAGALFRAALPHLTELESEDVTRKLMQVGQLQSATRPWRQVRPALDPGLVATYCKGENFEQLLAMRVEPLVSRDWKDSGQSPVPQDHFSVRWVGWLFPETAGPVELKITSDDGHRLWIDGNLVMDKWRPLNGESSQIRISLGRKPHLLQIDYFESAGGEFVSFQWQRNESPHWQDVPAEVLFHTTSGQARSGFPGQSRMRR